MKKLLYIFVSAILALTTGLGVDQAQATTTQVVITNLFGDGNRFNPEWVAASPDGAWLAFIVRSNTTFDSDTLGIWVAHANGNNPTQVLSINQIDSNAGLDYLSWGSPNTLFVRVNYEVWKLGSFLPPPVSVESYARPTTLTLAVAPNPSALRVDVTLTTTVEQQIEVVVYDVAGRKVETLRERSRAAAGLVNLTWKPKPGTSGVFFIRARSGSFIATSRAVVLQ